jgi:putative membrane protein
MWEMHDGMGWWMVFGSLWFVVFWGIVIWAVVKVVNRNEGGSRDADSAIDIASKRYARGEISREDFERIRRDLSSQPGK